MAPRRYRSDRRKAAADETRRRIVQSTVELHAERGVVATSYAMIAERADVAVPTVYNHFPTRSDLLGACTGQVAALAPPLGPQIFEAAADVESRLRALVGALFAHYRYYAPWRRWAGHEARLVPELAAWLRESADTRRRLIELALEPDFGATPPAALLALSEVLLDFPAWQRLAAEDEGAPADAETILADALLALVGTHRDAAAAGRQPKPRSKRSAR